MAILGIHHVAIIVPSIERGIAFYNGILGFSIVEAADIEPGPEAEAIMKLKAPKAKSVMLKSAWGYLELFEFLGNSKNLQIPMQSAVNTLGIRHICLAVDDCQAEYKRLKSDMDFNCPPINLGWSSDGEGPWVTYGHDPFGNLIELWQLTDDDPQLYPPQIKSEK